MAPPFGRKITSTTMSYHQHGHWKRERRRTCKRWCTFSKATSALGFSLCRMPSRMAVSWMKMLASYLTIGASWPHEMMLLFLMSHCFFHESRIVGGFRWHRGHCAHRHSLYASLGRFFALFVPFDRQGNTWLWLLHGFRFQKCSRYVIWNKVA